ncbi:cytochrome b5 domain-containing protein [Candidatus Uhrbacteria bacterium]|nr:cytochrome b5 domain-containing protein [Candidatus Uhrbacteria bacterium]
MNLRIITLAIVGVVFIGGSSAIIYYARPVMQIDTAPSQEITDEVTTTDGTIEAVEVENEEENEDEEENENEEFSIATTSTSSSTTTTTSLSTTTTSTPEAGTYTMATVESHHVENDCWAIVDTNVYDLTSWVSRHPGGNKAIINLCGTNATTKFNNKHSSSSAAKAALVLLKIGTLAQ